MGVNQLSGVLWREGVRNKKRCKWGGNFLKKRGNNYYFGSAADAADGAAAADDGADDLPPKNPAGRPETTLAGAETVEGAAYTVAALEKLKTNFKKIKRMKTMIKESWEE